MNYTTALLTKAHQILTSAPVALCSAKLEDYLDSPDAAPIFEFVAGALGACVLALLGCL